MTEKSQQKPRYPRARGWVQLLSIACFVMFGLSIFVASTSPERIEFVSSGYANQVALNTVEKKIDAAWEKFKLTPGASKAMEKARQKWIERDGKTNTDIENIDEDEDSEKRTSLIDKARQKWAERKEKKAEENEAQAGAATNQSMEETFQALKAKALAAAKVTLEKVSDPDCICRDLTDAQLNKPLPPLTARFTPDQAALLAKRSYLKTVQHLQERVKTYALFAAMLAALILMETLAKASAARLLLLPTFFMTAAVFTQVALLIFHPPLLMAIINDAWFTWALVIPLLFALDIFGAGHITAGIINHAANLLAKHSDTPSSETMSDISTDTSGDSSGTSSGWLAEESGLDTSEVSSGGIVEPCPGLDFDFSFDFLSIFSF